MTNDTHTPNAGGADGPTNPPATRTDTAGNSPDFASTNFALAIGIGMTLGIAVGTALGVVFDKLALGVAMGPGVGMALGVAFFFVFKAASPESTEDDTP